MVRTHGASTRSDKLTRFCMISLAGLATCGLALGTATFSDASTPQPAALLTVHAAAARSNLTALEDQQAAERAAAHNELDLPAGYTFSEPVSFPEVESQVASMNRMSARVPNVSAQEIPAPEMSVYEEGYFVSIAAIDWQCAWLDVAVAAAEQGDQARAQEAVSKLESFEDSRLAEAFPDYPVFLSSYVRPVLDGQYTNARSFLSDGCTSTVMP